MVLDQLRVSATRTGIKFVHVGCTFRTSGRKKEKRSRRRGEGKEGERERANIRRTERRRRKTQPVTKLQFIAAGEEGAGNLVNRGEFTV